MIQLPTEKIEAKIIDPKTLCIFGKPKTGKSTTLAMLPDSLLIDTEDGSDYINGWKVKINTIEDLGELYAAIKDKNDKLGKQAYRFLIFDTITGLIDKLGPLALKKYKETPQGKTYDGIPEDIPYGGYYTYIRIVFWEVLEKFEKLTPHLVFAGHIKESQIPTTDDGVTNGFTIDIPGKLERIFRAKTDAIAYLKRKDNQCIADFRSGSNVESGTRAPHLSDKQIVLSEQKENGEIISHWDKIFTCIKQ